MRNYDKEARAFNLAKFNAKHRMFKVYLDKKEDAALIEHLDQQKNKSKAIRKIMKGAIIPVANVTFDEAKLKELTDDIVRQIQNGELVMVTESETQAEWRDRMKEHFRNAAKNDGDVFRLYEIEALLDGEVL